MLPSESVKGDHEQSLLLPPIMLAYLRVSTLVRFSNML